MEILAIGISIFSILIATFSLGWNIYKDVIMKPRIKVSFAVIGFIHDSQMGGAPVIRLNAVNMGPGQLTTCMPTGKNTSLLKKITRKTEYWNINPDFNHPYCSKLPRRLDMAESIDLIFPYNENCFLKNKFTHFGIYDSFGKVHWAPKVDIERAQKQYQNDFRDEPETSGTDRPET